MSCSFEVKDGKITNLEYEEGNFDCSWNELTSLEGCPEKVEGGFRCSRNKLTSLKGCPKEIKGDFDCSFNQLTSLEYCPEKIKGNFDCFRVHLTSLEGCPKEIKGHFYCSQNQLTSLEGCPKKVEGKFSCSGNFFLVDISDLPSKCESIYIRNCPRIAKFPNQIKNILKFWYPTGWVRRRIKKQPFYEVIEEDDDSITVRQKTIGKQLLDDL